MSFDRMQCAGRYDAHPHVRSMANEGQEWASFAMCRRFFRASERCDVGDVICTDFGENHRSSFTGIAQPDPSKMNALAREPDEHKVARLTNNKILYVFAVTFFCTMRLYFETGSIRYRIHITPSRRALFPSLRPSRRSRPTIARSRRACRTEAPCRRRACPGRRDRKMHPGARPCSSRTCRFLFRHPRLEERRGTRGRGARRRAKRAGERTRTPRGSRGTAPRDEASRGVCAAVWGRAIALIGKTARRARETDTDVKLGPRRSHVSLSEDRRDLGRGLGALPLTPPWLGTVGPERRTRRRPCDRRAPHAAAPGARQ